MSKEEKLNEAIKLLEKAYYKIYAGYSIDTSGLHLIEDINFRNEIAVFIKSVNPESKLKTKKITQSVPLWA